MWERGREGGGRKTCARLGGYLLHWRRFAYNAPFPLDSSLPLARAHQAPPPTPACSPRASLQKTSYLTLSQSDGRVNINNGRIRTGRAAKDVHLTSRSLLHIASALCRGVLHHIVSIGLRAALQRRAAIWWRTPLHTRLRKRNSGKDESIGMGYQKHENGM